MSGHSKWAQIKRQKGVADIKKGQAFTKFASVITIAVRQGGGIVDPAQNFRLRLVIEKARQMNMPSENIKRAIQRAAGRDNGGLTEVVYEGFGPGKVGIMVEATTDNKQRTSGDIRNIFEKRGGSMASSGAVSYQFEQKGLISIKKGNKTIDEIFEKAVEVGAEDIEEAGDEVLIYTKPEDLGRIKAILEGVFSLTDAELARKPVVTIPISDKQTAQKLLALISALEDNDDVQKVYANFEVPDEFIAEESA
ncbi:MAG: hypothetical protein A3J69_02550 [Candidatus Levybacteria bacterium RIFCSPHIGHO2_02_FULL_42_12]|nr:MAG: hypothetical protein A2698_00125 [Candidatus Levybacteria bacterium RIFCSPHIGHO2_01_FULL_42_15]OGH33834.1 MAG: hypothetical protein A3J69_02550 [Candidatus Levybacteria bacterium RIFCSPHIGHO2_02_FULL_42_12]OGH42823.1 MAG: hypothetical protein A3B53_01165 [Candidatus Levybacteria bacterium RIFCSPLOWO2_01_FULL_42_15]